MSQNRNRWLDIAKGIAIILMVAGHTPIPSVMSHFIFLKSASNLNGNLNCSKELEHYAS